MVMASLPNPTQFVAHEFVRQYYTILHKDPAQLHRFYTKESKFTHGGTLNSKTEELISGQEAIFEKIRELNFRESYAKIRSVDSHPTLGNGVVIQVTGELSNAGMPMRKFMQTFVLARQAAKKYSVYNDIFRYQDEIFDETENEDTVDGTIESDSGLNNNHEPATPISQQPAEIVDPQINNQPINNDTDHIIMNDDINSSDIIAQEFVGQNFQAEQQMYGLESGIEKMSMPEQPMHNQYQLVPQEDPADSSSSDDQMEDAVSTPVDVPYEPLEEEAAEIEPESVDEQVPEDEVEAMEPAVEEVAEEEQPIVEEIEKVEEPAKPATPEVFSWAALAKKNTQPSATKPAAVAKPAQPVKQAAPAPKKVVPQKQAAAATTGGATTPTGSSPQQQQQRKQQRPPRDGSEEQQQPQQRRRQQQPDSHQIFIGNLPYGCSDADIRGIFEEYGSIVEIRLNPKNFGFVAFDNPDSPTAILGSEKAFTCGGQTINIEVKQSNAGNNRRNDNRNDRGDNDRQGGARGGGNFRRGGGDGRMSRGGGDMRGGDRGTDSREGGFNRDSKRGGSGGGRFGGGPRRPTSSDNRGGAGDASGQKNFQQGSAGGGGNRGDNRQNQQQARR